MTQVIRVRFQWRRDTAANWSSANPILLDGETGFETDTRKFKVGDGATPWAALPYPVATVTWGNIAGVLSSQSDLSAALGAKANTSSLAAVATSGSASDLSSGTLSISRGGTGSGTQSGARTALGLGSMATQGTGASGTFTTADSKTITVANGIITSIA